MKPDPSSLGQVLADFIDQGKRLGPVEATPIVCAKSGWSSHPPTGWWLDPVTVNPNGGFDCWTPIACWDPERDGPIPREHRAFTADAFRGRVTE